MQPPEVEAETTLQGIVAETVAEAIPAPEPDLEGDAPGRLDVTDPDLSRAMEPVGEEAPEQWTFDEELPATPAPPRRVAAPASIGPSESPFGAPRDLGEEDPLVALAREVAESSEPTPAAPPRPPEPEIATKPEIAEPEAVVEPEIAEPEAVAEPEARGSALEDLGDPAEWDFLEETVPAPPAEAKLEEPIAQTPKPVATPRRLPTLPPRVKRFAARAIGGGGWVLCVGLILAGLGQTLRVALAPVAPAPLLPAVGGGLEVRDLVARNLENLHAGPILVVSGVVAPRGSGPSGMRLQLLDAEGRPLEGAEAWAGPPVAERALREYDPSRLRADQAAHSHDLVFGGAFDAIFSPIPSQARGVSMQPAPIREVPQTTDRTFIGPPRPSTPSLSPPPSQE